MEGRIFYWGRQIDWMITTPLLLLDLALLALALLDLALLDLARWQRIINPGNQADRAGCVHYPNGPSGRVQPHRLRQGVQVHRQHGRDDRPPST
ncbi:MAG TPA: bacteriorhodopsin [Rubrobacter sp.]|nr:bacteriorhodopsin [Rubrobacter sp.]